MKNAKISPNRANSSLVRINNIYGDEKWKDFAKQGEFFTCKNK